MKQQIIKNQRLFLMHTFLAFLTSMIFTQESYCNLQEIDVLEECLTDQVLDLEITSISYDMEHEDEYTKLTRDTFNKSLVVKKNLWVGDDLTVKGKSKFKHKVKIKDNLVVDGNAYFNKNIKVKGTSTIADMVVENVSIADAVVEDLSAANLIVDNA